MIKFPQLSTTLLSAILLLSSFSSVFGQCDKLRIDAYVNQYKELAVAEMLRTGVPAAVTLAQGILETAGGQSDLAAVANNHFGIKCKSDWTGEFMYHDDDAKNERFRKYATVEDSYRDHSDFLKSRPMYAFLFKLDPTDYEGWAKGLKRAGYATSSTYAQKLIRLIVENNLQSYTLLALQHSQTGEDLFATGSISNKIIETTANADEDDAEVKQNTPVFIVPKATKEKLKSDKYPLNAVFNINESKVIYAEAGTSLLALANNYKVGLKKLIEFNELDQTDILTSNQLIFLQKKSKKGNKDIHVVEVNESLHDISQTEGIQLSAIMEYNGLQKGMQPATGERIYLKAPAPSSPRLASARSSQTGTSM